MKEGDLGDDPVLKLVGEIIIMVVVVRILGESIMTCVGDNCPLVT